MVVREIEDGRLALALNGWNGVSVPVSVVYPSSRFMNTRLRAFIDLLVETFPDRKL
jgi:LysR family transcriptional regulator, regulator for bpeEF and oprC